MIEVEIKGTNTILEFPEGTPQEVISNVIKKHYGGAAAPEGGTQPTLFQGGQPGQPSGAGGGFEKTPFWKKAVGVGLPIAGDIGMSLYPPLKAASMAGKLVNFGLRVSGAGLGSYAGSLAGQKIEKGEIDYGEAEKEALFGVLGEGVLGPVFGVPAKWVAEKVAEPTAKLLSAITTTSSKVTQGMKDRMVNRATERALKFVEDLAPDVVKRQDVNLGSLGAMVESAVSEKRAMYDFYENILRKHAEKKGGVIELPKTMNFLEEQRDIIKGMSALL